VAAGAEIVLSVHHNYSFSSPKMNHAAVFFGSNDPGGKALAQRVAKGLHRTMRVSGVRLGRDIDILGLSLTLLEPDVYTAILTEASFYSHPRERRRLNDDAYLKREAKAIFRALHGFVLSSLESSNP
jgi:N-acetylmuramoyl-L-alanine amidase